MSDLKKYINNRRKKDKAFDFQFEEGFDKLKIGIILKEARESAGLTQEDLALKLHTNKSAISRIENHAEGIRISTLVKVSTALGKKLRVAIV